MIDCGIINCFFYDKECFIQTVLTKKPDQKTGCSYCKMTSDKVQYNEKGNKIRKTRSDKGQKREKKGKKRKKEKNSLQEIL